MKPERMRQLGLPGALVVSQVRSLRRVSFTTLIHDRCSGAVIGGAFETPANRWPDGIGSIHLFVDYPYLLPCGIAASVTFMGAILSLFLGWDGGPREGLIRLPLEKDMQETLPTVTELHESPTHGTPVEARSLAEEPRPETVVDRVAEQAKNVQKKVSGYFARRVREAYGASPRQTPLVGGAHALPVPGSGRMKPRTLSQVTGPGSAYGYSGGRSRLGSTVTGGAGRSPGAALRRRRLTGQSLYADEEGTGNEDLTFAQRLLLGLWFFLRRGLEFNSTSLPFQLMNKMSRVWPTCGSPLLSTPTTRIPSTTTKLI